MIDLLLDAIFESTSNENDMSGTALFGRVRRIFGASFSTCLNKILRKYTKLIFGFGHSLPCFISLRDEKKNSRLT